MFIEVTPIENETKQTPITLNTDVIESVILLQPRQIAIPGGSGEKHLTQVTQINFPDGTTMNIAATYRAVAEALGVKTVQ